MVKRITIWPMLLVDWAQRKFTGRDDVGASLVEYALLLGFDRGSRYWRHRLPWRLGQ